MFNSLEDLEDYLPCLRGKVRTTSRGPQPSRFEIAETRPYPMNPSPPRPCVVWERGELTCTVLFTADALLRIADHGGGDEDCDPRTGIGAPAGTRSPAQRCQI